MDEYERELAEWRGLVGATILSFGDIELITVRCLVHLPTDKIYESVSTLPFGRRIDLIVEILESRTNALSATRSFVEKLKRAKALAEYRNVLAHNPLLIDMYIDKVTGDVAVERAISSARKREKAIDLESLKELAAEVENLASELYMAFGKIIEEADRGGQNR